MKTSTPIRIYGANHSPWVQGVALHCHLRGLPYHMVSCPDSLETYLEKGMVMPVCRWPDGTITGGSFAILRQLEGIHAPDMEPIPMDEAEQKSLERLFYAYVFGRAMGGRKVQFLKEWSKMPTENGGGLASCFRLLMFAYFFILIAVGRKVARKRGLDPDRFDHVARQLEFWSGRLEQQPFLSGESPGALDCALMGHIQCMLTGLTDEVIPIIENNGTLMAWIERMQVHLKRYPHDFTPRIRQPSWRPESASLMDQTLFWLSFGIAILCLPVTAIFLLDALNRRNKNPDHSGARLTR